MLTKYWRFYSQILGISSHRVVYRLERLLNLTIHGCSRPSAAHRTGLFDLEFISSIVRISLRDLLLSAWLNRPI
jgi:hypothetical protein